LQDLADNKRETLPIHRPYRSDYDKSYFGISSASSSENFNPFYGSRMRHNVKSSSGLFNKPKKQNDLDTIIDLVTHAIFKPLVSGLLFGMAHLATLTLLKHYLPEKALTNK